MSLITNQAKTNVYFTTKVFFRNDILKIERVCILKFITPWIVRVSRQSMITLHLEINPLESN